MIRNAIDKGARPGCSAILAGQKLCDAEEFKPAPPPKDPPQGAGWDRMERKIAVTHDNSV